MSHENESHRAWRVQPCTNPADWWTIGYIYEGNQGTHQGAFVPVYHWTGRREAEAYCGALLDGCSREEARLRALAV